MVEKAERFLLDDDAGYVIGSVALAATSLALLTHGSHLIRPLAVIVGGVGATVASYMFLTLPCTPRLVVALLAGLCTGLFALCLFKTGLVLIGAAGFAALAHFVYDATPLRDVDPPFKLAGRSGYYVLGMAGAIILGSIVAYVQKKNLVRLSSSLIGGGGVAATVHLVGTRIGEGVPPVALLVVMILSTVSGVLVQRRLDAYRDRRRNNVIASA